MLELNCYKFESTKSLNNKVYEPNKWYKIECTSTSLIAN